MLYHLHNIKAAVLSAETVSRLAADLLKKLKSMFHVANYNEISIKQSQCENISLVDPRRIRL
jgi:hypothetical protein